MPATKLGIYELLAPQFLAGFTFPPHVDKYLAFLSVEDLRTAFDESGIVYTGRVAFGGEGEAAPRREHEEPSGGVALGFPLQPFQVFRRSGRFPLRGISGDIQITARP